MYVEGFAKGNQLYFAKRTIDGVDLFEKTKIQKSQKKMVKNGKIEVVLGLYGFARVIYTDFFA